MTLEAAPLAPRRALAARRVAGLERLPLLTFVGSRLLVLAAGAVGALLLAPHEPGAAAAAHRAFGPLGYVLSAAVDRFDSGYYLDIAAHGYGALQSHRVAFFPLYPMLIRLLTPITGSGVLAGAIVSLAAFLGALTLLGRLAELELGAGAARATTLLVAFAPLSFFFGAVYTESLFLLLTVGSMYAARRERWRLACVLGALATLTRPTGIALGAGLLVARIRRHGLRGPALAWVLALPGALGAYLVLLAARGYPLLAPFAAQTHWYRITTAPPVGLAAALWAGVRGLAQIAHGATVYRPSTGGVLTPGPEALLLAIELVVAIALLVWGHRRGGLAPEHTTYGGVVIVLCLSSCASGQPLWSFDRFLLTLFPVWMAGGALLARRPRLLAPAVLVSAGLLAFYATQFSTWAFVA